MTTRKKERFSMHVYIAGPSKSIDACQETIQIIEESGHTITVDWTKDFTKEKPDDFDPMVIAERDEIGIGHADLIVLVYTSESSAGSMTELGYARALRRPIIIRSYVGAIPKNKVFMHGYLFGSERLFFPIVHSNEELSVMLNHYKNKLKYSYP